MEEEKELVV